MAKNYNMPASAITGIYVSIIIAALWALPPIVHKQVFNRHDISPRSLMITSSMFHVAVIVPLAIYYRNELTQDTSSFKRQDWAIIACTSVFAGIVANLLYYDVIKHHESYVMSAVMYSSPLFVFIFSLFYLHERVTIYSIIGMLFIMIGIFAMAYHEHIGKT